MSEKNTMLHSLMKKKTINFIRKAVFKWIYIERHVLSRRLFLKITGDFEAKVIATALWPSPEEYLIWILRLLANYCVEQQLRLLELN